MPSKSPAQHRLMEAAAHTEGGYGGVPQGVGQEFVRADKHAGDTYMRGAGIMYVAGNLILLGKRAGGNMPGSWDFPGGHSEEGETPIMTALRESREEVGAAPMPDEPLHQIDFSDNGYIGFTTFIHRTKPFALHTNEEHTEWRWCDVNNLPSPLLPAVAMTIEKFKAFGAPGRELVAMDERMTDVNGWLEVKDNPISKVGVFPYLGKNVDNSFPPDQIVMVLRPEEELSDPECIDSFKLVPWIDEHVMLGHSDSGLVPAELKGVEGVIGENVYYDNGVLYANIKVFSDNMDTLIGAGKRELSAGYRCKYEISSGLFNGQRYDAIQRRIRGNHLALVKEGRMGPDVAVLDHLTFTFDAKDIQMPMDPETKKAIDESEKRIMDAIEKMGKDSAATLKAMDEKICEMKDAKDGEEEEKTGEDADEEKKKDEEKKAEDRKAMDASIKSALDAALAPVNKMLEGLAARTTAETAAQDAKDAQALRTRLADFGYAVDSADTLTLPQLREAAVAKIGLKCAKGGEQFALDGYFHDRQPLNEVGFALDSAARGGDAKAVDGYFKSKAA